MISYGMHVGSVIAAVLEIFAAITGSVFCCHGVCSGSSSAQQNTVIVSSDVLVLWFSGSFHKIVMCHWK